MAYDAADDGRRDFHFLYGRWQVAHRRLVARGVGCTEWDAFGGVAFCQGLMGGLCNVDENDLGEYGQGLTFRSFDVERQRWSIYWVDGASGALEPPVHGRFEGGVGRFEGDDACAGRPVKVRFLWEILDPGQARWTQSFSYDAGATWETNWIMDFTR
ncbi:DUF1579 domain-containing protein [Phenylobacterium sp.]|uniref:DUF1579 domain-containing protein n=1 Tax=Phenylobacterium sp. TaxID=1871053 RepID=UPI0025CB9CE1|nr:DUF1579 domain-containing protein [Phenylobacterium sp.]MBX3485432.1 DUF1579 domain-containing protein [Phenylobacterium sp.]MCW5760338.1 DUF1579 domain-containing protein [Phenylobacterium sp.]